MSHQITEEVLLLLVSMYGGLILILCYDAMRIWRRIFSASVFRVIFEDVIFWTVASIFMFNIFLKYNYGIPRFYAIAAALGIMVLYEWLIGRHVVKWIATVLNKIGNYLLKPLKKVIKEIKLKYNKVINFFSKKVIKCLHIEQRIKCRKDGLKRDRNLQQQDD